MSVTARVPGPAPLFGSYDIRGRYPSDFPAETCRRLADSIAASTAGPLVVAHDVRRASERLERSIAGRLEQNRRVVLRLGVQPTPVVGFASGHLSSVGLAFTPSHNALGYAGIKAFTRYGRAFGSEWRSVRDAYDRSPTGKRYRNARPRSRSGAPSLANSRAAVERAYLAHVTRELRTDRSVVVDGRGGPTTRIAPAALARVGARVTQLNPQMSSRFHGLSPEPTRENVRDLGRRVRSVGGDFGVAFDGDGDRAVFVDERGQWVEPEVIATLLHDGLSSPAQPLVASVDASQRCESRVRTARSRVGSRYISATMRRQRAVVGFEASSHFYLDRWGPNSDGILTACVVAHLLARAETSLGERSRAFGPIARAAQVLEFSSRAEAERRYRSLVEGLDPAPERGIDGVVYRLPEGSVLLRRSNTQPAIRVTLEATSGESLAGLRQRWNSATRSVRSMPARDQSPRGRPGKRASPA